MILAAEIILFAVDQELEGNRLGTKLFTQVREWAVDKGAAQLLIMDAQPKDQSWWIWALNAAGLEEDDDDGECHEGESADDCHE